MPQAVLQGLLLVEKILKVVWWKRWARAVCKKKFMFRKHKAAGRVGQQARIGLKINQ
jgi:hypothetical protein